MKSTGMTRKVDNLGRIVLPKELRDSLEIGTGDALEIFVDGENVVLNKYEPCCIFCGEASGVWNFKSKNICEKCSNDFIVEHNRNRSYKYQDKSELKDDDINL